jgi:hypothetical protein
MPESERPAALVPSATEAATSRSYLPVNSITRVLGLGANVPNLDGVQKIPTLSGGRRTFLVVPSFFWYISTVEV